jgi:hypothetical protein
MDAERAEAYLREQCEGRGIYLLSYAQTAVRGMLTMIDRMPEEAFDFFRFTASDDQGAQHRFGLHGLDFTATPVRPRSALT